MTNVNIMKKGKKYFSATIGLDQCKILINDASMDLGIGIYELELIDISVRCNRGTDFIFKLDSPEDREEPRICSLKHGLYNQILFKKCQDLGGDLDVDNNIWIFDEIVSDKVEDLDYKYNSKLIPIEIFFVEDHVSDENEPLYLVGFPMATINKQNLKVNINQGISLIDGSIEFGGEKDKPITFATKSTVIRMMIPELCLVDLLTSYDNMVVTEL